MPGIRNPAQAIRLQRRLSSQVSLKSSQPVNKICRGIILAVDVGYDRVTGQCLASMVIWDGTLNRVLDHDVHIVPSLYPYVPGLL
jgi:deoxyinosine 3'endonuclease (endonuclease V)